MTYPAAVGRRQILCAIGMGLGLGITGASAPALAGPLDWLVGGQGVAGNGAIKQQHRAPGKFSGISLHLPATVELRSGTNDDILIETDDNLLPLIDTVVENGVLYLRPVKRHQNLRTRTMKMVIQVRELDRIIVGGDGSVAADLVRSPTLRCNIDGAGSIALKRIDTDSLSVNIAGSGDFKALAGSTGKLAVAISGSGDVELDRVTAQDAEVSIAGSGDVRLAVRNTLHGTIAGSGDISYYGDPKLTRSIAGSGEVHRAGPLR